MPDSSDGVTVDVDVTTPDPAMQTGRLWIAFHERAVRGSNVAYYADLATALDRTARWYWRGVYGTITRPVAWHSFAGGGLWQLHDADGHTGVVVTTDELHGAAKPSASLIDSSRPETDSEAAQRRGRFFLDIWREKDRTPCIGFVVSETRVALNGDSMARLMVGDLEVLLDDSDALQRMRAAADSVPALLSHGTYEGPPIPQELADALNGGPTVMLPGRDAAPAQLTACGRCRRPFDPADRTFDGAAESSTAAGYCRGCVDNCHEGDVGHRCVICHLYGTTAAPAAAEGDQV